MLIHFYTRSRGYYCIFIANFIYYDKIETELFIKTNIQPNDQCVVFRIEFKKMKHTRYHFNLLYVFKLTAVFYAVL